MGMTRWSDSVEVQQLKDQKPYGPWMSANSERVPTWVVDMIVETITRVGAINGLVEQAGEEWFWRFTADRTDAASPLPTTLGEKIREARKAAGLKQTDVAARAGIDVNTLSDIERDVLNPSVAIFMRIAAAVGVPPASLLPDPPAADGN